uniref:Uncharacterized protein n=1 Tax=Caenorhabditis japonica TaxID=281687 RepID=A0A8R1IAN0_CAEJA
MNSSLVMVAAVFNSYLTRQPTIPEITTENVEEKEESVVAKKSPKRFLRKCKVRKPVDCQTLAARIADSFALIA